MTTQAQEAPTVEAKEAVNTELPMKSDFTGLPGNFAKDMAALVAEEASKKAQQTRQENSVVDSGIQPEITVGSAAAPVTIPDKFKTEDGSLNADKVIKSTIDAEAALMKYAAKEKELRQKMNEVNRLSQSIPGNIAPIAPATNQVPLTAFEIQVANDLINEAAAYGYQMPQGQAIAQARVQVKMAEARHNAEVSLTENLRIKLEDQERRSELEAIAQYDPNVLTPEGFDALSKIRESKPWINQSPKPWTEAYDYYLADQMKKGRKSEKQPGTVLPTPMGQIARPPATPIGPTPRAVVQSAGPDLTSYEDVNNHVKNLSKEEEAKFWKSKGLRF